MFAMDLSPVSEMQVSTESPTYSPPSSVESQRPALKRSQLLERLRRCADLDKQFFLACYHALYTERTSNGQSGVGASDMSVSSVANDAADIDCDSSEETPENTLRNMLTYLNNFDEREKIAIDREESLNRQYEALEAELSQSVPNNVSTCQTPSSFFIQTAHGRSRLCFIGMVISAKEEEQTSQLYDINRHNFETDGVYLPRLPGLLREGETVELAGGLLGLIPQCSHLTLFGRILDG
ncbi:hypothetical protein, conserved [Eimeria praecox]|uniref:Uncharacterized protein n=1 Tax=Eimeria praecox TaxID=51316 RepID=U6G3A9_9EIME|nr:hypothetical protein, conserved [Eimeria praecox]